MLQACGVCTRWRGRLHVRPLRSLPRVLPPRAAKHTKNTQKLCQKQKRRGGLFYAVLDPRAKCWLCAGVGVRGFRWCGGGSMAGARHANLCGGGLAAYCPAQTAPRPRIASWRRGAAAGHRPSYSQDTQATPDTPANFTRLLSAAIFGVCAHFEVQLSHN